jgi:hypothetical protein
LALIATGKDHAADVGPTLAPSRSSGTNFSNSSVSSLKKRQDSDFQRISSAFGDTGREGEKKADSLQKITTKAHS